MNRALKWKLVAGLILVFLAGAACGIFVGTSQTFRFLIGPGHHGFVAQAMRNRLRAQLHLTDDQLTKITPIIDKAGSRIEEIRADTGHRVRQTIAEAHRDIAPILTPEQRQQLEQMEARHRQWMHRRRLLSREATATPPATATPQASPTPAQ